MLDMGFREDLERLLDAAPKERRTLMFSATIPKPIATLAKHYQHDALRIATVAEKESHRDIEYIAVPIVPRERDLAVVNLLRYFDAPGALVFCATRDGVTHLTANLAERGFSVASLSGELTQRERNTALQALRDGRARVCVATDVAARGLDLPDLGLVIHADMPQNQQVLVHRSGRTGRAGKHGTAIVLVADQGRRYAERMLQSAHIEASWRSAPSSDDIRRRDREQLTVEIKKLALEPADDDQEIAKALLAEVPAEALAAALVRARREARPVPEELTVPPSMRPRAPERAPDRASDRPQARPQAADRPARAADRPARPERAHRDDRGAPHGKAPHARGPGGVWFTINVGRSKNADPKWLIPLLCRRGDITKQAIGKIQVMTKETRVEIAPDAAEHFATQVRKPDTKDKNIHIERVDN
jgi:ATP-dependent RNA helicase DeaD